MGNCTSGIRNEWSEADPAKWFVAELIPDGLVNPLGIGRLRWKQIYHQEIDSLHEDVRCFFDERADGVAAVFVARRDNLDNSHDIPSPVPDDDPIGTSGVVDAFQSGNDLGKGSYPSRGRTAKSRRVADQSWRMFSRAKRITTSEAIATIISTRLRASG
jgi:hypothetical protein